MKEAKSNETQKRRSLAHELEGAVGGAVAGAAIGAFAGPVGSIAGAVFGGAVGAITETVLENEEHRAQARRRQLDDDTGVTKGSLGAPNLKHPPAKVGSYSGASAGVSGGGSTPAEGPISSGEGDE